MQCPVCDGGLKVAALERVEINNCTKCMGIWLDRGELAGCIYQTVTIESDRDYVQNDRG